MSASAKAADMVKDGKQAVTEEARAKAETVRDDVADSGEALSDAAKKAAGELDGYGPVDAVLTKAGDAVAGATAQLRERSIPDLVDDVSSFARRNPLLFLGGAALAGFAAARFVSAGSPRPAQTSHDDVWSGHADAVADHRARD